MDKDTRRELLEALEPGDVVPAGFCPSCGAAVYPASVLLMQIRPRTSDIPVLASDAPQWDVSLSHDNHSLIFHLRHPEGFGCELILEIDHERPELLITPFNNDEELLDAEAIAQVKIGNGHVLFADAPAPVTAVRADEEGLRTELLTSQPWPMRSSWTEN